MKLLYAEDLETLPCPMPGCTGIHAGPMYLYAFCHMEAGTIATFVDGDLLIECFECGKPVARVAVKSREGSG